MLTIVDRILTDNVNYIALAVPFFFLLIGIELLMSKIERKDYYRFDDSINDLSCGIIEQIVGIFIKGGLFAGYLYLYANYALTDMTQFSAAAKMAAAFTLFLGVDFAYYWFHRIAHEVNAPWAAHIVHHQSEQYNLTVALRQGTFQGSFSWVFYLPLAILGFPPAWYVSMAAFDTLYQFWIHTRAIGKLGPLEWVLNTPSHHRVHHARNPKYIDKNYAGTLIIWDRMFGSFIEEEEEPVYGIVRPLNSWNPVWANFHRWVTMGKDAWAAPRYRDKLKIWFMPPAWKPEGLPPNPPTPEVSRETTVAYATPVPRGLGLYILLHFVLTLLLSVALLRGEKTYTALQLAVPSLLVLWSLVNVGGIFESRRWLPPSEFLRLAAVPVWLGFDIAIPAVTASAIGVSLISAGWLCVYRKRFYPAAAAIDSVAVQPEFAESLQHVGS